MIKVGFIDYFLDEYHANNYPKLIKDYSNGRYEVTCAYGHIDGPNGKMTNKEWSEKTGIPVYDSIEKVIDSSDVLIVLSPDNPEMHEELTDLPLKSGKLVYVDKTFALTKEKAVKIFKNADEHGTKCCSSSALRFSSELEEIDTDNIVKIYSEGPGNYDTYSIHQLEMIVALMKKRVKRIMALDEISRPSLLIEFEDGRLAQMRQCYADQFKITIVNKKNESDNYIIQSNYFGLFIENLIKFFDTGEILVPHEQTVDVIALREIGEKAFENPYQWINL